jgi:hypothetical protein
VNEEERARRLSDMIDAIVRGDQPELDLDDDELIELLRIARLRRRAGKAHADIAGASREYGAGTPRPKADDLLDPNRH